MALPQELLILIVENLIPDSYVSGYGDRNLVDLKSLRLTHRFFAYLPQILRVVFDRLTFVASPEGLQQLISATPSVSKYVRTVSFVGPPKSWFVYLGLFQQVVRSREEFNRINADAVTGDQPVHHCGGALDKFIQEELPQSSQVTDQQIEDLFYRYTTEADRIW